MLQKKTNNKEGKKKILIFTNHSYMLWQFRRELIFELMKDYEVVLVMPFVGHEEDFREKGIRCVETDVDRRGINPVTDLKLIVTYRKILRKERPDQVITYSIKPNVYAGWLCGRMGIPYCANVQGLGTAFEKPVLAAFVTVLYRIAFGKVQKVFFENRPNGEEFRRRNIIPADRQVILPGAGINMNYYSLQPYPRHKKIHFLYLGRIMKEKGIDELFWAVRKLHTLRQDFVLDLVGFYEEEYREQTEQLEKEGIVIFHGFQQDPRPFYKEADCVILPSYHEGMSNVLLEAAAVGRPLITSDIPGCREAVDEGQTGFLVLVRDRESLYGAMEKFMALPESERQAMGLAGHHKMLREFQKDMVVQRTIREMDL